MANNGMLTSPFFYNDHQTLFPRAALSGNGEMVTCFSRTGFHDDTPTPESQVFVLAGRRYSGVTQPLVRLGQIRRRIVVDGEVSAEKSWRQDILPDTGIIISRLEHEKISEETTSFICLGRNSALFRTLVTNISDKPLKGIFEVSYRFGDWSGQMPGVVSVRTQPRTDVNGCVIHFEVESRIAGHVELLANRPVHLTMGEPGQISLSWTVELEAGKGSEISFLLNVGDKLRFQYMTDKWGVDDLFDRQVHGWMAFHGKSSIVTGNAELDAMRQLYLYDLRCNSTPWSIPPLVSPSQWEGRTFHDELYPFLGLASSGHLQLASKIPSYRLGTLDKAVQRSAFKGAKYGWESAEDGSDASPYGPWLEEHFHMGQFAEAAWQYCLYTGSGEDQRFYPLLKEIADYFLLNLIFWRDGEAVIRPCTDYDETIHPVENGLYTVCAAVRSLELAATIAQELDQDQKRQKEWTHAAQALRKSIPIEKSEGRYLTAAAAKHRHIAEVGPVFPFRIDPGSPLAVKTIDTFCKAVRTEKGLQPGDMPNYGGSRWLWTTSHVSTAYSIACEPDKAFQLLQEAPLATAPGLTPAEHVSADGHPGLPWFTTAAGAFVFALNSLFVQITDHSVTRLPALPEALIDARFSGLAGAGGLSVSAKYKSAKAERLELTGEPGKTYTVQLSTSAFSEAICKWPPVVQAESDKQWLTLTIALTTPTAVWHAG